MRLLFLYTRDRESNGTSFATEGLYALFSRMVETGIVDKIKVIIDSNAVPGPVEYGPGFGVRVERISPALLIPGDIVWVRGGFKPWLPVIDYCQKNRYWLLFYGANTGRERWPFWDVVFDDLSGVGDRIDQAGRIWLDYRKPVNEGIFKYDPDAEQTYDLCIGASHVHDKKGQWRGAKVAAAYRDLYGEDLRCILPGSFRRGVETAGMVKKIRSSSLDILLPGMIPRRELAEVFNFSRIFCHLGSGGQGDRGPMEAMRCGCPVVIGFPGYHAPWVRENGKIAFVPDDPDDYQAIARHVRGWLTQGIDRRAATDHFDRQAGIENITLPRMKRLFDCLRQIPEADRQALSKAYGL